MSTLDIAVSRSVWVAHITIADMMTAICIPTAITAISHIIVATIFGGTIIQNASISNEDVMESGVFTKVGALIDGGTIARNAAIIEESALLRGVFAAIGVFAVNGVTVAAGAFVGPALVVAGGQAGVRRAIVSIGAPVDMAGPAAAAGATDEWVVAGVLEDDAEVAGGDSTTRSPVLKYTIGSV